MVGRSPGGTAWLKAVDSAVRRWFMASAVRLSLHSIGCGTRSLTVAPREPVSFTSNMHSPLSV